MLCDPKHNWDHLTHRNFWFGHLFNNKKKKQNQRAKPKIELDSPPKARAEMRRQPTGLKKAHKIEIKQKSR